MRAGDASLTAAFTLDKMPAFSMLRGRLRPHPMAHVAVVPNRIPRPHMLPRSLARISARLRCVRFRRAWLVRAMTRATVCPTLCPCPAHSCSHCMCAFTDPRPQVCAQRRVGPRHTRLEGGLNAGRHRRHGARAPRITRRPVSAGGRLSPKGRGVSCDPDPGRSTSSRGLLPSPSLLYVPRFP